MFIFSISTELPCKKSKYNMKDIININLILSIKFQKSKGNGNDKQIANLE